MATSGWPVCPIALGSSKTCEDAVPLKRFEYAIQYCGLVVVYFDYILTFSDEIVHIWARKWKVSTILYFFCRYSLVANLVYILSIKEDFSGLKMRHRVQDFWFSECAWSHRDSCDMDIEDVCSLR
ncbi:hypothetical protein BKA70DRAFT_845637 [Coprinopsis sp. MPI-PUGE-AT-0042]|nr:hypothetical protein BKA70DRAFT_845637 [Coprinopsis sp. MPI-PUGE-AT-0042]